MYCSSIRIALLENRHHFAAPISLQVSTGPRCDLFYIFSCVECEVRFSTQAFEESGVESSPLQAHLHVHTQERFKQFIVGVYMYIGLRRQWALESSDM